MQIWKMLQRTWEKDLLIWEYKTENLIIFRSEIIRKDINEAIKILKKNNKLDYKKKFFIKFIRKSTVMIILKFRINSLLHWVIMRLLFFSQVLESVSYQSVQSSENMSPFSVRSITPAKITLTKIRQSVKHQKITCSQALSTSCTEDSIISLKLLFSKIF